ncbi:MAG: hypothetical protein FJW86_12675 [Actinobacteria bacterium]|nr:hypothetical protein [Actinomycetota bacterium]
MSTTYGPAMPSSRLAGLFGWRAERRPEPGFAHVLGAGAAFFLWLATNALVGEVASDDVQLPGILFNAALLVIALLVGALMAGPVRTGAVALCVFTVPVIWGLTLGEGGPVGDGDTRLFYILTIVSYSGLATLLWTRGRGILVGLVLLLVFSWVVWEVDNGKNSIPFQGQIEATSQSGDGVRLDDPSSSSDAGDNTTETSVAALGIGLVYLGAAAALDRKKLAGLATPFIVAGFIATVAGASVLGFRESVVAGGLALALAGLVIGLVGGLGMDRRFSTWTGVILVVIGVGVAATEVPDSNLGFAGLFALIGVGLAGAAWLFAPILGEFTDGDVNAGKVT